MTTTKITAHDETEAAIFAEGTTYTKADILREYRSHLDSTEEPMPMQRFCSEVLGIRGDGIAYTDLPEYRIAFVLESGGWDVAETFHAANDDAARSYCESEYGENDVFVLDRTGRNINGGVDG